MPLFPKTILKQYFETGDTPTQSQFHALIDSSFNLIDNQGALGFRVYSTTHNYIPGDVTVYSGEFYQAIAVTSGTFNPSAWTLLDPGGPSVVSGTYAELFAIKGSSELIPGQLYFISDRNIWISAISGASFGLDGYYLAFNADYQNTGGNNMGVWRESLTGIVPGESLVIWNNLHWLSVTGDIGNVPDTDPVNWSPSPPTTDTTYVDEVDNIKYDFDVDFMFERSDKRGNVVTTSHDPAASFSTLAIDTFQWGRDGVFGNVVKNSVLRNMNAEIANFGIEAVNSTGVIILDQADCSRATFSNSILIVRTTSNLLSATISDARVLFATNYFYGPVKRHEAGFSDFETELDITSSIDINLTSSFFFGIFNLNTGNSFEVINTCTFSTLQHPVEFRPVDGVAIEIMNGSGSPGEFSMSVSSLYLNGSTGDYAIFKADELGVMKLVEYQVYYS